LTEGRNCVDDKADADEQVELTESAFLSMRSSAFCYLVLLVQDAVADDLQRQSIYTWYWKGGCLDKHERTLATLELSTRHRHCLP
jgi:hypothetical protein